MLPLHHRPTIRAYASCGKASGPEPAFIGAEFRFRTDFASPAVELAIRCKITSSEAPTPQLTPQVSEVLEKALALSTQDRDLIIDRLIESLDNEPAEEGIEVAWSEEIKRRVEEIQSGKVKMIPGEEVDRRLAPSISRATFVSTSPVSTTAMCSQELDWMIEATLHEAER